MRLIHTLILLLELSSFAHGQNLLYNTGFESGTNAYSFWTDSTSTGSLVSTTSDFHSGMITVTRTDTTTSNYWDKIWQVQVTQSGFSVQER